MVRIALACALAIPPQPRMPTRILGAGALGLDFFVAVAMDAVLPPRVVESNSRTNVKEGDYRQAPPRAIAQCRTPAPRVHVRRCSAGILPASGQLRSSYPWVAGWKPALHRPAASTDVHPSPSRALLDGSARGPATLWWN